MTLNDTITDSGEAFMGQGISDAGGTGNVQLWNPYGTGKLVYLDRIVCAGDQNIGADMRFCREAIGSIFAEHVRNKVIDGPDAAAEIRTFTGTPPNDYPYNRPAHEIWLGGTNNDRTYLLDPPVKIPQGRGVVVSMAGTSKAIVSYQWREKDDPLGPIQGDPPPQSPPAGNLVPGGDGTIDSDLNNPANVFDGNDSTYANDAETNTFRIGKKWAFEKTIIRIVLKSPTNRSFSGGNPGRFFTWSLETFDGSVWSQNSSGTYTEHGTGTTQSVVDFAVPALALGHRLILIDEGVAAHRVGTMEFYE